MPRLSNRLARVLDLTFSLDTSYFTPFLGSVRFKDALARSTSPTTTTSTTTSTTTVHFHFRFGAPGTVELHPDGQRVSLKAKTDLLGITSKDFLRAVVLTVQWCGSVGRTVPSEVRIQSSAKFILNICLLVYNQLDGKDENK